MKGSGDRVSVMCGADGAGVSSGAGCAGSGWLVGAGLLEFEISDEGQF